LADLEKMVIQLQLNSEQMQADLKKVEGEVDKFGHNVEKTKKPVEGLGGQFKELGKTIAKAFAAAEIVKFLYESAKAAGDDAQSFAILENQLKNTTGATAAQSDAIDKQLEAMSNATGTKMPELRNAYGQLLRATGDSTKALQLQKTALDLAATAHVPVETAAKALARAQTGNMAALNKLDPALKNSKNVMGDLAKQTKGAADAAANANPFQKLGAIFENIKVTLGKALLPIFNVLANALVKLQPVFDVLGKAIGLLVPILTPVIELVAKLAGWFGGVIAKVMPVIVRVFQALWPAVQKLLPVFEELVDKLLPPLIRLFDKALIPALLFFTDILVKYVIPFVKQVSWGLGNVLAAAIDAVTSAFIGLGQFLKPIWDGVIKPLLDGLMALLGIKGTASVKVKADASGISLGEMAANKAKKDNALSFGGAGSTATGGVGTPAGSTTVHHHKHTHITTKVSATTNATPTNIAANIVNAIKFNLPVTMAGGTGTLTNNMGSQLGMGGAQ